MGVHEVNIDEAIELLKRESVFKGEEAELFYEKTRETITREIESNEPWGLEWTRVPEPYKKLFGKHSARTSGETIEELTKLRKKKKKIIKLYSELNHTDLNRLAKLMSFDEKEMSLELLFSRCQHEVDAIDSFIEEVKKREKKDLQEKLSFSNELYEIWLEYNAKYCNSKAKMPGKLLFLLEESAKAIGNKTFDAKHYLRILLEKREKN